MNITDRMILDEYKKTKEDFVKIGIIVREKLRLLCEESGVLVMGIEHRVKEENSLAGKLRRYADRYHQLSDLTDILGARVICYFEDGVDVIGKLVEEHFVIDWDHSSDKRTLLNADTFGYLSLHYICLLPQDAGYPEELCDKRFEIQIRSILQHAWSAINHDLGYKNEFGVPREVTREFARLAGLLEIADAEFVRARDHMNAYTEETREKIIHDNAQDVLIDMVSLNEYMLRNKKMRGFLARLAAIEGSEIDDVTPESYILQLRHLKMSTIGDLQSMLEKYEDLAYVLAENTLLGSELDILTSSVALRFLCQALVLESGFSEEEIAEFLSLSINKKERALRQAKRLLGFYREYKEAQA